MKILWIAVLAIAVAAGCIALIVLNQNKNKNADASSTSSASSSASASASADTASEISVKCNSYSVYTLDDADFGFVIAKAHVKAPSAVSLNLDHFTTEDGIKLSAVSEYTEALNEKGYSLETLKTADAIITSSDTETDVNLFIPYKNKDAETLKVTCDLNANCDLSFNLSSSDHTGEALKKKTETAAPTEQSALSVTIDHASEIDPEKVLTDNEEAYFLPSTARVFGFHVHVTAPSGQSVQIVSASFDGGENGIVQAEKASVHTSVQTSIINQSISDTGDGYLFIILLDPGHTISSINGTMNLQMSDASQNASLEASLG
jgi:hypothetical protein